MMTEVDRLALMNDLGAASPGLWREIRSELQRGGAELPIWVLVNSRDAIRPAFDRIMAVTQPYRARAEETAFSVSLDEIRDGKLLHWNHVEPDEINAGRLWFVLGSAASEGRLEDSIYAVSAGFDGPQPGTGARNG